MLRDIAQVRLVGDVSQWVISIVCKEEELPPKEMGEDALQNANCAPRWGHLVLAKSQSNVESSSLHPSPDRWGCQGSCAAHTLLFQPLRRFLRRHFGLWNAVAHDNSQGILMLWN